MDKSYGKGGMHFWGEVGVFPFALPLKRIQVPEYLMIPRAKYQMPYWDAAVSVLATEKTNPFAYHDFKNSLKCLRNA